MCNKSSKQIGGGCSWGRQCFPGGCAGGPQTLGCEDLGGICFTCAVGGAFHAGDVTLIPDEARTIVRIVPEGSRIIQAGKFGDVRHFEAGRLIVGIQFDDQPIWPANEVAWVALEGKPAGVRITWHVLSLQAFAVEKVTTERLALAA